MQDEVRGKARGGELGRLIEHISTVTGTAASELWSYLIWTEEGGEHAWHEDGHGPTQADPS